ncbi:putative reverse transcriptase domain-containing protein [Tanacetum coccineum]
MSMTIRSSIMEKILAAQGEASKVENATTEMLRGLDQQMDKKEDGGLYFIDQGWGSIDRYVWWPCMKKEIATYVSNGLTCSKVKDETSENFGSKSGHDTIWVIVDRLTKSAHFLATREDYSMDKLARLYISEIKALGLRLNMSTAYHLQTNGQSERTIQILEDMLRACAKIGESRLIRPELVQETTDKVILIKERLKAARDFQNSYVGNRRKQLGFEVGDKVILKVSSWKEIKVDKTLRFVEEPVEIIDHEVKSLKRCRILIGFYPLLCDSDQRVSITGILRLREIAREIIGCLRSLIS